MNLIAEHYIYLNIIVVIFQLMFGLYVWSRCWTPSFKERTRERMRSYARLKGCVIREMQGADCKPGADGVALCNCAHEVLLGTLKKVEQKSATLLTAIIFANAFFLNVAHEDGDWTSYGLPSVILGSLLILPTLGCFIGMRQLDTHSTCKVSPAKLQTDLLRDLVRKEMWFRFAYNSAAFAILLFLLVVVGTAINDITKNGHAPAGYVQECKCSQLNTES